MVASSQKIFFLNFNVFVPKPTRSSMTPSCPIVCVCACVCVCVCLCVPECVFACVWVCLCASVRAMEMKMEVKVKEDTLNFPSVLSQFFLSQVSVS